MVFIASLLFSGLVVLSLSMNRHHQQMRDSKLLKQHTQPIRWIGWGLLTLCAALCIQAFGFGIGLATFFAILSLVGFIQVALLSYAPKTVLPLSIALPLSSGFVWMLGTI